MSLDRLGATAAPRPSDRLARNLPFGLGHHIADCRVRPSPATAVRRNVG